MRFKNSRISVGAAVEQTQLSYKEWIAHVFYEHVLLWLPHVPTWHPFLSILNQNLYFTTETAGSSEPGGSKFQS